MSIRLNGEKIAGKYESQTIYPASESEAGIIKIASSQDVKDGTDNTKAVTPRRLKTNYATKEELNAKQNKLVAGENIIIDQTTNTISSTGGHGASSFAELEGNPYDNQALADVLNSLDILPLVATYLRDSIGNSLLDVNGLRLTVRRT